MGAAIAYLPRFVHRVSALSSHPVILRLGLVLALTLANAPARASMFSGEAADTVADVVSWIAIFLAPAVLIGLFWYVHILPEKVAEKRKHPQAKAIQVLCLLSLVFGGLLWPIALLWAYSKPVLYRLAYGTDTAEEEDGPTVVHGPEEAVPITAPGLAETDMAPSATATARPPKPREDLV